jgi:hypothetical protein
MTVPWTSVNRRSMPFWRKVDFALCMTPHGFSIFLPGKSANHEPP